VHIINFITHQTYHFVFETTWIFTHNNFQVRLTFYFLSALFISFSRVQMNVFQLKFFVCCMLCS